MLMVCLSQIRTVSGGISAEVLRFTSNPYGLQDSMA